jgi:cellulose synthase (UDP-forming)
MSLNGRDENVPNESVIKRRDYPVFVLLTALNLAAIVYFLWQWLSLADAIYHPITFSLMTIVLLVILVNNQGRWFLLPQMRRPGSAPALVTSRRVAVVTSFVPEGESIEMLMGTVAALTALDYPHDTWVLDEGDSPAVQALCRRLGANYFTRKHLQQYQTENGKFQSRSKHGNYNAWLYEVGLDRYDIISAFDPDHVPRPDFLSKVLPYFEHDKVAYVQTPQAYYNQGASFIARGAAEETYSYFSCIKMASYGMGFPIIVGGHNTHRVSALKQVGGFGAHDADDLALTFIYRTGGWQGVYLPQILARGLTPVDWNGYIDQQRRWARSVVDVKLRFFKKAKNLPWRTRIMSMLHGLNYLYKSLAIMLSLTLLALMLSVLDAPSVISWHTVQSTAFLFAVLQISEAYRQRFFLDWESEHGLHWRAAVLHIAKWPYIVLGILDVVLGRKIPYILTPKTRARLRWRLLGPHLTVGLIISVAWLAGELLNHQTHPLLRIVAGVSVALCIAVMVTELMDFPHPYDKDIAPRSFAAVRPVDEVTTRELRIEG